MPLQHFKPERYPWWRRRFPGLLAINLFLICSGSFPASGRSGDSQPAQVIVHAKRFAFTPAEITLEKGKTTRLVFISDDATHGLVVDGLGIKVEIKKGKKTIVPVNPTQSGDFAGSCSVFCGSGHRDMEFMIHVVD